MKKSKLTLSLAHPDMAYTLASSLCQSDRTHFAAICDMGEEWLAEYMDAVLTDTHQSFAISDEDGVLQGIWGHSLYDPIMNIGELFLLSSETLFPDHLLDLTRDFRREVLPVMDKTYDALICNVRSDNHGLVRWLVKAGFRATFRNELGGEQFVMMTRRFK